ncbi:MAG: ABC transporter permease [Erysipelotrichaceae bacterium]
MKQFSSLIKPYMLFAGIFIVIPMMLIALYAFTQAGNEMLPFTFTLDNFIRFFDPVFIQVLLKSLYVALLTTLVCLIIGYPIAYIISKFDTKVATVLILLITIPMLINMLVRTYSWIGILSEVGLINNILGFFNLGSVNLLYTDFAVILGMVYNTLPFMIIQIYNSLSKMDKAVINASYDLGANRFQTFRKVIFPLSLPGVISGITLVFLPSVSSFVVPRLLGGGQYMLIGNLIENQFITVGEWNFGSAISLIMALIIMLSMYLTKKIDQNNAGKTKVRRISNGRS